MGGFPPMPFLDTDLASWEWCFRFNLHPASPIFVTAAHPLG